MQVDYFYMGDGSDMCCAVAMIDATTGYLRACVVEKKGAGCNLTLAYTNGWLEHVGHRRLPPPQCGGEPAIQEFVRLATVSLGEYVRVQRRTA